MALTFIIWLKESNKREKKIVCAIWKRRNREEKPNKKQKWNWRSLIGREQQVGKEKEFARFQDVEIAKRNLAQEEEEKEKSYKSWQSVAEKEEEL